MPYRCIIVDDDLVDRLTVVAHAKKYDFLRVEGVYDSPTAALAELSKTQPRVLFLDIDMGEISGLDLRKQLLDVGACIFITSYPDYAVDSFELAALDFMVKPIQAERFEKSMQRLEEYLRMREKSRILDHSLHGDYIFVKDGYQQYKVRSADILYLEALKDYTVVVTEEKRYCVHSSLGNLLKEDSFQSFVRVHRSYAVQKHYIQSWNTQELQVSGIAIPIGRSYKNNLLHITD